MAPAPGRGYDRAARPQAPARAPIPAELSPRRGARQPGSSRADARGPAARPAAPARDAGAARAQGAPGRGLTVFGGVCVELLLALAGGLFDAWTSQGLGWAFAVCFVLGSVLAAVTVRLSALRPLVVATPLVYGVVSLVVAVLDVSSAGAGTSVKQVVLETFTSLIVHARPLVIATLAVAIVALARRISNRPGRATAPAARPAEHR